MLRKILPFLLISFGLSWTIALLLYASGTVYGGMSSQIMVAVYYMWGPATAAILLQTYRYKSPLKEIGWNYENRTNDWLYLTPMIFCGIFVLHILILLCFGNLFGISAFGRLDFSDSFLQVKMWELAGSDPNMPLTELPFPAWVMFFITIATGFFAGAGINLVFTFGEELGWRGYLLKNTQQMGFWKTTLLTGIIWGIWHAPLVAMGHNFPDEPIKGILVMTLGCLALTPLFNYTMHKSGSILIPSLLHAMINGTSGATILFLDGGDPLYTHFLGFSGILSIVIVTIVVLMIDRSYIRRFSEY